MIQHFPLYLLGPFSYRCIICYKYLEFHNEHHTFDRHEVLLLSCKFSRREVGGRTRTIKIKGNLERKDITKF